MYDLSQAENQGESVLHHIIGLRLSITPFISLFNFFAQSLCKLMISSRLFAAG